MVLCKLQMLLFLFQNETREDSKYCLACGLFQVVLSKKTNINKTQTNKNPKHNITPTNPQSLPFQQFQLFCCLCLTFLRPQKSSKGQETRGCMGTLATGATGPLQSGRANTGNIFSLSHHQYSCEYSITRYFVTTSPPPGHKTARSAVSGRNRSMPKLNLTVLLFKITTGTHAIYGHKKLRKRRKKQFPGL